MYDKPTSEAQELEVKNINPYLVEGDDLIISKRSKPICNVPKMIFGSKLIDGGNFTLTDNEKEELLKKEPESERFIRPILGGKKLLE